MLEEALNLFRENHLEEAEKLLRKIIQDGPEKWEAHRWLGAVLAAKGEKEASLLSYEEASRLRPEKISSFFYRAKILSNSGDPEEAIRILQSGLQTAIDEDTEDYKMAQGTLAFLQNKWAEAERYYWDARKNRNEEDDFLYSMLSETLTQQKKYQQARVLLEKLILTDSASWLDWRRLGFIEFRLGNKSASIRALETAINLNRNDSSTWRLLATVALRSLRFRHAIKYTKRVLEIEK